MTREKIDDSQLLDLILSGDSYRVDAVSSKHRGNADYFRLGLYFARDGQDSDLPYFIDDFSTCKHNELEDTFVEMFGSKPLPYLCRLSPNKKQVLVTPLRDGSYKWRESIQTNNLYDYDGSLKDVLNILEPQGWSFLQVRETENLWERSAGSIMDIYYASQKLKTQFGKISKKWNLEAFLPVKELSLNDILQGKFEEITKFDELNVAELISSSKEYWENL